MAPRHVFVVARAHPSVYEYLTRQFTEEAEVEILLDRRRGDRRRSDGSVDADRRRADRRARPDVDMQLRDHTHVFLTLPDPASAGPGR